MGEVLDHKKASQWSDKGTYKEPKDKDNIRVPRLEVDDATTFIDKDVSDNMTFEDAVTGSKTLAELSAGGGGGVDTSGTPVANDYAQFTDADTIRGREKSEVLSDLNVADGADVTGSNPPQAHGLDSHTSATLANLNADISDATLVDATAISSEIDGDISTHAGLADPHTGYRLESADHSHQTTGAQAGKIDHGAALDGLGGDDHTQYILHSLADAANDFLVASGDDAFVKKTLAETLTLLGLDPLLDNSMADALHRHSELSASDGSPDRALVVDAAGQVGIGTASPDAKLEVAGTEIRVRTSTTPKLSLWTDGADVGCRNWVLRISHIAFGDFNIVQSNAKGGNPITAGTSRLYIDESGNVGIGVTDPDTKLEILNAGDQLKLSFDGTDNAVFAVDTNGILTITPSGAAVDFASKNLTGLGTLSAFTLGGTMDANSQALINVLDLDLGTESLPGTFSATLTAANAGTAWLIKSKSTSDILRPRLGLSGGVDTAVWGWVNSTHTGIVLSGALNADSNDINNVAAPGAAGDPLIKGTRVTTAELPAVTDEFYLVGTGANMEERAVPSAGAATMEFFVPSTYGTEQWAHYEHPGYRINATNDSALIGFYVPHDYSSIVEAVVVRVNGASSATYRLNYNSSYGSTGEGARTHQESLADQDTAETPLYIYEQDISGILSAIIAGDHVGIVVMGDSTNTPNDVITGVRFKYS